MVIIDCEVLDGITLCIDVETELGSLDGSFYGSNYSKLEEFLLGDSLGSTDDIVIVSDEGIELGLSDVKILGNITGNVDGITLGIDAGTDMCSLY